MSVTAGSIEAFAHDTLKMNVSEVAIRCAIGRLYYCCFHSAVDICNFLPSGPKISGGIHAQLANILTAATSAADAGITKDIKLSINKVGYILNDLKAHRNAADYDLDKDIKMADAAYVQERTKVLLEHCNIIFNALTKDRVQA